MRTPAWKSLKPQDRVVYIEIHRLYNGHNNGRLALSNRDVAKACNISKDTACKCFQRLIEKGFLNITYKGSYSVKTSKATEYAITIEGIDGKAATKDFASWRPPEKKKRGPKLGQDGHKQRTEITNCPRFRIVGGSG